MSATTSCVSYFVGGKRDTTPVQYGVSPEILRDLEPSVAPPAGYDAAGKAIKPDTLPLWSPAVYPPGARRDSASVSHLTYLVADIDGAADGSSLPPDAYDRLLAALRGQPHVGALLQTTYNHTPDAPRMRLTLPLSRPVTPAEYQQMWGVLDTLVQSWVGARLDPATRDVSRMYFTPAVPTPEAKAHYRSVLTSEAPADVDAWVSYADAQGIRPSSHAVTARDRSDDIDEARRESAAAKHFGIDASKAVQDVSDDEIDYAVKILEPIVIKSEPGRQGNRHAISKAMGGKLSRLGWSADSVYRWGLAFAAAYSENPNTDHHARNAVNCMAYPSGHYDLVNMVPVFERQKFAAQLDAVANPQGRAIQDGRNAIGADMKQAFEAARQVNSANDVSLNLWNDDQDLCGPVSYPVGSRELGIAPGAPFIIAAHSGVGKSWLANTILAQVNAGEKLLGRYDVSYAAGSEGAVFISLEMSQMLTRERWQATYQKLGMDLRQASGTLVSCTPKMFRWRNPMREENVAWNYQIRAALVEKLKGKRVAVIDSLRVFVSGVSENDSAFRDALDWLADISEETGCAIGLIHHTGKPSAKESDAVTMRGSSAIFDAAGAVITMHVPSGETDPNLREIRFMKNRLAKQCAAPIVVSVEDGAVTYVRDAVSDQTVHVTKTDLVKSTAAQIKQAVRAREENASIGLSDLCVTTRQPDSIVKQACAQLCGLGDLKVANGNPKKGELTWYMPADRRRGLGYEPPPQPQAEQPTGPDYEDLESSDEPEDLQGAIHRITRTVRGAGAAMGAIRKPRARQVMLLADYHHLQTLEPDIGKLGRALTAAGWSLQKPNASDHIPDRGSETRRYFIGGAA